MNHEQAQSEVATTLSPYTELDSLMSRGFILPIGRIYFTDFGKSSRD